MIDSANGFFGVHESLKDVLHHHHEKIINLNVFEIVETQDSVKI